MPWRVETPMSQRQDFVETQLGDGLFVGHNPGAAP